MKHNNIDNIITSLSSVRMTKEEKMKMKKDLSDLTSRYQISPYSPFVKAIHKSFSIALIALLTIASVSKPASANALPGQLLYPVKIIHEEIESVSKTTPEKKIDHEIKRTEKRIQEATMLARKQTLDTQTQNNIAVQLKKHTDKVKHEIQSVKQTNPQKALSLNERLESTIKENKDALKEAVSATQKVKKEKDLEKENIEKQSSKEEISKESSIIENKTSLSSLETKAHEITIEDSSETSDSYKEVSPISEINELDLHLEDISDFNSNDKDSEDRSGKSIQEDESLLIQNSHEEEFEDSLLLEILELDLKEAQEVSEEVKKEIEEDNKIYKEQESAQEIISNTKKSQEAIELTIKEIAELELILEENFNEIINSELFSEEYREYEHSAKEAKEEERYLQAKKLFELMILEQEEIIAQQLPIEKNIEQEALEKKEYIDLNEGKKSDEDGEITTQDINI